MNLKELLSKFGTKVYTGMPAANFVKAVVSVPVAVQVIPELGALAVKVDNMLKYYDSLQTKLTDLKKQVETQEQNIDKLQSSMNKAQRVYSYFLTDTPPYAVVSGTPGTVVQVTKSIAMEPAVVSQQATLTAAEDALEEAKSLLKELEKQVTALQATITAYYDAINKQVQTYVDSIINTRVL